LKKKVSRVELDEDLLESVFDINYDIELDEKDIGYLCELQESIRGYIIAEGLEDSVKIRESISDSLVKEGKHDIINYLSLDVGKDIKEDIKNELTRENFKKIDNIEDDKDFFKFALTDETLNDIYYTWLGYAKKTEGSKEIFIKIRAAIIPKEQIDAIYKLLVDNFNKINFFSKKEDEEQARIIIFTLKQILEILLGIPASIATTQKVVEIMSVCAVKMMNLIGFSKDFRSEFFSALSESYESKSSDNKNNVKKNLD